MSFAGTMLFVLPSKNPSLMCVNLFFLGFAIISVIPVSYAFSVELTYPVSEAVSNGTMIMFAQSFGTILVSIFLLLIC